jgi:hypothetical protein
MASFPQLSPEAVRVLRIMLDQTIVRGGDLVRYAGMKQPSELMKPVDELLTQNLIEVSGDISEQMLPFATFGIRPSAREYLNALVQRR